MLVHHERLVSIIFIILHTRRVKMFIHYRLQIMLKAAAYTSVNTLLCASGWDNCVFSISFTESQSVTKIHLPFTWEKSCIYSTRITLILLCSPQRLYILLKAGIWKRVIRRTTSAPQGIIIVIITICQVILSRCGELKACFSLKLNTRSCWFLRQSVEEQLVCLIFHQYQIEVGLFCGLAGRFCHSFKFIWNCIHSGSHSYFNHVHVKFPHKHSEGKFIKNSQSGRLFFFLLSKTQLVPYETELSSETVCVWTDVCVCACKQTCVCMRVCVFKLYLHRKCYSASLQHLLLREMRGADTQN